jgi:excisionase family DNA binding protein
VTMTRIEKPVPRLSLTIPEAVVASGIPRSTLYEHLRSGRLRSVKIGRRRLILVSELEAFLRDGRRGAA